MARWIIIAVLVAMVVGLGIMLGLNLRECDISQEEYDAVVADRNGLMVELDAINEVYPPRQFTSVTELERWLHDNPVLDEPDAPWIEQAMRKAIRLQQDALADGYLINVDYDYDSYVDLWYAYNTTIINGRMFFWQIDFWDVTEDTSLGTIE